MVKRKKIDTVILMHSETDLAHLIVKKMDTVIDISFFCNEILTFINLQNLRTKKIIKDKRRKK